MHWSFRVIGACSAALKRNDLPSPVPALVSTGVTTTRNPVSTLGLDGEELTVGPVALAAAVPGAPGTGVVVDRTLAQRAAYYHDCRDRHRAGVDRARGAGRDPVQARRGRGGDQQRRDDRAGADGTGAAGASAGERAVRRGRRGRRPAGGRGGGARAVPGGPPAAARVRGADRRPGEPSVAARVGADRAARRAGLRLPHRDRRRAGRGGARAAERARIPVPANLAAVALLASRPSRSGCRCWSRWPCSPWRRRSRRWRWCGRPGPNCCGRRNRDRTGWQSRDRTGWRSASESAAPP